MPADELPPPPPADVRPWHGSLGAGGALLATGEGPDGSRLRVEGEVDLEPGGAFGRYGGALAIRAADRTHRGIATAGVIFEAAAARPRVVLELHADVGFDLDVKAPAIGGGIRTVVGLYGPLGLAFDAGPLLVIDGVSGSRFVLSGGTSIVVKF